MCLGCAPHVCVKSFQASASPEEDSLKPNAGSAHAALLHSASSVHSSLLLWSWADALQRTVCNGLPKSIALLMHRLLVLYWFLYDVLDFVAEEPCSLVCFALTPGLDKRCCPSSRKSSKDCQSASHCHHRPHGTIHHCIRHPSVCRRQHAVCAAAARLT